MKRFIVLAGVASLVLAFAAPVGAGGSRGNVPDRVQDLRLGSPLSTTLDLEALARADAIMLRLAGPSVAEQGLSGADARAAALAIQADQDALIARILDEDPEATILASTQLVLNAVFVQVGRSALEPIAADPVVGRIVPVGDYELDLSETVPYIGASAVQTAGFDGSGVSVAVLDSGIDYYHAALGGSGNPADYDGADPNSLADGGFPNAKVVGGFDFVGSVWPDEALAPDPDPLDDGTMAGHGTHVGHIIGGTGGVAPGVDLYAVKVCSSVSTSCSGVALIEGMEFAADPNGDLDTSDAVDIVNMSLGSIYGQPFDDDLSQAVDNATNAFGILTVASAGNSADKPYVTGSPAAAPTALSVAQTQVPSAGLQFLTVDGVDYQAIFQPWSVPLTSTVGPSPMQYGDGAGGNLLGCSAFAAGSLTGTIVLVDRGACNFTLKIKNIGDAGGEAGIIGLVAPGAPFQGGAGADAPITIPGYMISQADSNAIKAQIAAGPGVGTLDPANQLPLIGQMVGSSSRGPTMGSNAIKPEIGAPGASVSAIAGTGTGQGPFGGTSGAAPMVSGSAALLLDAFPLRSAMEVKSLLINTGETDIDTDPFAGLAPITRIGGGEVRVDRAHASSAAAWESATGNAALSFGFDDTTGVSSFTKEITVHNYSGAPLTYDVIPTFRYGGDAALTAVSVLASPSSIVVPAAGSVTFELEVTIDGSKLKGWSGNSGSRGADPTWLTDLEFDGYVELDAAGTDDDIHLPWHVLPRRSGDVAVTQTGPKKFTLANGGTGATVVEAYTLLATSSDLPEGGPGAQMPIIDLRAVGYSTIQVPAGFCGPEASFVIAFAVNTWERQTHANAPALFFLDIDVDNDGEFDYEVLNADFSFLSGFNLSDGRNVTIVENLDTGDASAFFFTDHETNSANTVLYTCAAQFGLSAGETLQAQVAVGAAFDLYFQGAVTDFVFPLNIGPGIASTPVTFQGNNSGVAVLGPGSSVKATLSGTGITNGALLLFRGGAPEGNEAAVIGP